MTLNRGYSVLLCQHDNYRHSSVAALRYSINKTVKRLTPALGGFAIQRKEVLYINNFYNSKKWKTKRENILRRDNYLCQENKRYGMSITANTVHHIFPSENFPELILDNDNLISLHSKAHDKMHDRTGDCLTVLGLYYAKKRMAGIVLRFPELRERIEGYINIHQPRDGDTYG